MKKRVVQPISFNMMDEFEGELHAFAVKQQKYFSRYVKRLIAEDKKNKELGITVVKVIEKEEDRSDEDIESAISFL